MTGTTEIKKISFGSWAFILGPYAEDPIPFPRAVERIAQTGYDGVEICGLDPHVTLENCSSSRARQNVARLIADHGLGISGYHPDFSSVNPTLDGNEEAYLQLFHRYVDLCVDIGSPMLRVDSVASPESVADDDYLAAMNRLADIWAEAADIAETNHVVMAWEFEPGRIFNKLSEILAMHQKVDHPNFKILFDTAHAYACGVAGARQHGHRETLIGGVPEFLKKVEGRTGALHVMDSAASLGEDRVTHRVFEEGVIDFRLLGPQLVEVPVEWWCVDLAFCPEAWDLMESSRDYVQAIMDAKTAA